MFADLSFFVALGVTLIGGILGIAAFQMRNKNIPIITKTHALRRISLNTFWIRVLTLALH